MILASLRWVDAKRSSTPVIKPDAIDSRANKSKSSDLPMFWYCPRKDLAGSEAWHKEWIKTLV